MKNQRPGVSGWSLVEVMIAGALFTVVCSGVMSIMRSSTRAAATVRQGSDFQLIRESVRKIVARGDWCGNAFRDANGEAPRLTSTSAKLSISSIRMGNDTNAAPVAEVGKTLPSGFKVTDLSLELVGTPNNPQPYPVPPATNPPYLRFDMQLKIHGSRSDDALGNRQLGENQPPMLITLYADVSGGAIQSCAPPMTVIGCTTTGALNFQPMANENCPNGGLGMPGPNATESPIPGGCPCQLAGGGGGGGAGNPGHHPHPIPTATLPVFHLPPVPGQTTLPSHP